MANLLFYLLAIPLASLFIADYSGVIQKFKYWLFYRKYTEKTSYQEFRIKPLDCPMCLSFWIGAISLIWIYTAPISLILPWGAAGATVVIQKLINQ